MKKLFFGLAAVLLFTAAQAQDSNFAIIAAEKMTIHSEADKNAAGKTKMNFGQMVRVLETSEKYETLEDKSGSCKHFYWYKVTDGKEEGWLPGDALFHLKNEAGSHAVYYKSDLNTTWSVHIARQELYNIMEIKHEDDGMGGGPWTEVKKNACFSQNDFLVLIKSANDKEELNLQDEVYLIKADPSFKKQFKSMPSLGLCAHLQAAFAKDLKADSKNNFKAIQVFNYGWGCGGEYAYFQVLELSWNGKEYVAKQAYYKANQ
jgi:hypothetical protein